MKKIIELKGVLGQNVTKGDRAVIADEQINAQIVLHKSDGLAYGGQSYIELFRGFGEAAALRYSEKTSELVYCHYLLLPKTNTIVSTRL